MGKGARKLMHLMPSIVLGNTTPREEFKNLYPDTEVFTKKDDIVVIGSSALNKTIMAPKEYGIKKMKLVIIK
jgi:hypothetical protein